MSWQDELRSSLKTTRELESFFEVPFKNVSYNISIPLFIAKKIKAQGLDSPLGKQFLPSTEEDSLQSGLIDPIGDHQYSPIDQIVHRYSNRILFFPTQVCPILCRYCFRKNELSTGDQLFKSNFSKVKDYLLIRPEIEEVIFSGGDPFILSNEKLDYYLEEFSQIKSIKYIRFHTRVPTSLPSRIDDELITVLTKYSNQFDKVQIVIHTNHVAEFSIEVEKAIDKLFQSRIPLLSQTVLLKGVNDTSQDQKSLIEKLIKNNITPYYLHHPDKVKGAMNFYLTIEDGRKIYSKLRKEVSGWALPSYVVDIPNGEGKVNAFNPETYSFSGQFLNKDGQNVPYSQNY
jgi:lysine 2,3-aminomutase